MYVLMNCSHKCLRSVYVCGGVAINVISVVCVCVQDGVSSSQGGADTDTILEFDEEYTRTILLSLEE